MLATDLVYWRPDFVTYQALELTNEETVKDLSGLVTVANILESLGGVLTGDIEHNLLTTAISCQYAMRMTAQCNEAQKWGKETTYGCSSRNLVQS